MTIQRFQGCTPYDRKQGNEYGYVPHLAPGIVFTTLFAICTVLHIIQASWKRRWWCVVFAIGALTETIGWGGRTWSSHCPNNLNAFLMQICTLILAPTFFTAGIYIILGRLIQLFGRHTSPISAAAYLWIFCTCDVISLVIQAVGGGMAATAVAANPPKQSKTGTDIMVSGIIFQMASITVFVLFFVEFLRRVRRDRHSISRKVWALVAASTFSCLMIYIRSIYRTVELLQGWSGYLITHESYFIALDASLMLAAVAVFNVIHPGWFIPTQREMQMEVPTPNEVSTPNDGDQASDAEMAVRKEEAGLSTGD